MLEAPDLKTRAEIWSPSPRSSSPKARPGDRRCSNPSLAMREDDRDEPTNGAQHVPRPSSDRPATASIRKLLEILVCPLTKTPLEYDAEKQELISRAAKLAYPIRDGIPIMLP